MLAAWAMWVDIYGWKSLIFDALTCSYSTNFFGSRNIEVQFSNIDATCSGVCWRKFCDGNHCAPGRENKEPEAATSLGQPSLLL